MRPALPGATEALHLGALASLALAQPVLDLLALHPAFFTAHGTTPGEVVALPWVLCLGSAALLWGVVAVAGLAGERAMRLAHRTLVGALIGVAALPALHLLVTPGWLALAFGGMAAIGGGLAYARWAPFRTGVSVAGVAMLAVPIVFLARVQQAAFPDPPAGSASEIRSPAPVVFLLFDGLRLADLMDAEGQIDAVRFPHFAALARHSTWYRGATTVADSTVLAVPALVTGRYPAGAGAPSVANHPINLFTLLAGHYELRVIEPVTGLCPRSVCRGGLNAPSASTRRAAMAWDLGVLAGHRLLPPDLAATTLPGLGERWANFGDDPHAAADDGAQGRPRRLEDFEVFLEALEPSADPTLYFAHNLIPHSPYRFLPSGQTHNAPPPQVLRGAGPRLLRWNDDRVGTLQAEKLYLLQVALVDAFLGRVLERLEESGFYDDALLVVTSDHGQAFRPGRSFRAIEPTTQSDLLPVPLFIKTPGQRAGRIDDSAVESVDVMPMLLDALGAETPASFDGRLPGAAERTERTAFRVQERTSVPVRKEEWRNALERKLRLFGAGSGMESVYEAGLLPNLLGTPVEATRIDAPVRYRYALNDASLYEVVDPDGPQLPCFVHGRLRPLDDAPPNPVLAVAVNGVVAAVTSGYTGPDGKPWFQALIPPTALRAGSNAVELFAVRRERGHIALEPMQRTGGS